LSVSPNFQRPAGGVGERAERFHIFIAPIFFPLKILTFHRIISLFINYNMTPRKVKHENLFVSRNCVISVFWGKLVENIEKINQLKNIIFDFMNRNVLYFINRYLYQQKTNKRAVGLSAQAKGGGFYG
jgi:hypothetical protein